MREYPCVEPEPGGSECPMEQCLGQLEVDLNSDEGMKNWISVARCCLERLLKEKGPAAMASPRVEGEG